MSGRMDCDSKLSVWVFARLRRSIAACVLFVCALYAATAAAQTPLLFVETYNRLLEEKKVAAGVDYRIEGRFTSIASNLLKLQECPQTFRPARGETFGKAPDNHGVVEVFGQIEVQEGKQVFVVSKLQFLRDDASMYLLKKSAVRGDVPDDWFKLARWAGRRGEFYDDDALRERANEANGSGIALEYRQLKPATAKNLLALAEKAAGLNLPDAARLPYVHEAHRITWAGLQTAKNLDMQPLLEDLREQLPGATERLPTPQPELEQAYRANPLAAYRKSDGPARKKLHRIFYSEVLLDSILRKAKSDGSSGLEIADQIDEALPELHDQAEAHRERELQARLERIGTLTRQEMLDLQNRFRKSNRPEEADKTVKEWLAASEEQLRQAGADGLLRAADQYVDLLEDREKGAALLREAYQLDPASERVAEKLTQLDYRLHNGQWIPAKQFQALPRNPIQQAIRDGRVVKGMTAAQVRSTLGAAANITRIATAGQLSELWVYGESGSSRLTVHLIRRNPRSPLEADRISQIDVK